MKSLFSQQTELGDRLLALHITRERLCIRLNQPWCHELGTATSIEPLPGLPIHQVSAERLTITLNLGQVVGGFWHYFTCEQCTVPNIAAFEIERLIQRILKPSGRAACGELLIQRIRFCSRTDAASASVRAVFGHGFSSAFLI